MLLIFKRLKRRAIDEGRLQRYLAYAVGEIILVVIGIMIAIQINSWNQNRIDNAELEAYLQTIAGNIRVDISKFEYMRVQRERLFTAAARLETTIESQDEYGPEEFALFARMLWLSVNSEFNYPNQSGFESLKNSGYLSKLRGQDIEKLLYDYYDNVDRLITDWPEDSQLFQALLQELLMTEWGIDRQYLYLQEPITDPAIIAELKPRYKVMLQNPVTRTMLGYHYRSVDLLIPAFDRQMILGQLFINLVDSGSMQLDEEAAMLLAGLEAEVFDVGNPQIYYRGALSSFFEVGLATSGGVTDWVSNNNDVLTLAFPSGQDWAATWIYVNLSSILQKTSKDYSSYSALEIEMKGAIGGEQIGVALKDSEDPDDGSEILYPLTLSSQWETYTINLAENFSNADLEKLNVVSLFTHHGPEAAMVQIRRIQYID